MCVCVCVCDKSSHPTYFVKNLSPYLVAGQKLANCAFLIQSSDTSSQNPVAKSSRVTKNSQICLPNIVVGHI